MELFSCKFFIVMTLGCMDTFLSQTCIHHAAHGGENTGPRGLGKKKNISLGPVLALSSRGSSWEVKWSHNLGVMKSHSWCSSSRLPWQPYLTCLPVKTPSREVRPLLLVMERHLCLDQPFHLVNRPPVSQWESPKSLANDCHHLLAGCPWYHQQSLGPWWRRGNPSFFVLFGGWVRNATG